MPSLRLAAAQLDTVVGRPARATSLGSPTALRAAEAAGADMCVFPELAITGYPPEDLLLKPGFVADNLAALDKVAAATAECVAVVGFVEPVDRPGPGRGPGDGATSPRPLANAAAVCAGGEVVGVYRKRLLPNYGVFDEQRWFVPGTGPSALHGSAGVPGGRLDLRGRVVPRRARSPSWAAAAPTWSSTSTPRPYSHRAPGRAPGDAARRVAEAGCAIAYVNQVGGQDELVFDGASLVVGGRRRAAGGRRRSSRRTGGRRRRRPASAARSAPRQAVAGPAT